MAKKENAGKNAESKPEDKYPLTLLAIIVIVSIVNGLTVIGLIIYFPVVYLNYTFTSTYLVPSDIPFYNAGLGSSQTDRYGANWFFCFFYALMIIPPVLVLHTIIMVVLRRPTVIFNQHN